MSSLSLALRAPERVGPAHDAQISTEANLDNCAFVHVSGVGTLLNRLFGTNFDVMDETRRQQTTKGPYSPSPINKSALCDFD